MPKVREASYSLEDAQRHMVVFRARIGTHVELVQETDKVIAMMNTLAIKLPKEISKLNKEKTIVNKDLDNAAILFEKELKKEIPKIDYGPIVKAIYYADSQQKALKIGIKYGITRNEIIQLMARAPIQTPLGKVMEELKIQADEEKRAKQQSTSIPADEPDEQEEQEENDTNYSDEIDDELKAKLNAE